MVWSFDASLATDTDRVRFEVGDTDQDGVSVENETIDALLVTHTTVIATALVVAKHMRAKLARLPSSRSVAGMTSQRTVSDMDLVIADLTTRANSAMGGMSIFGVSKTDIESIEADTDYVRPFYDTGGTENR